MARETNIKLRRSATQGAIPTASNLDLGELAINTFDGKLYVKKTAGSILVSYKLEVQVILMAHIQEVLKL